MSRRAPVLRPSLAAAVGVAVAAGALAAVPPSYASRTVSESYAVPAGGTYTLHGHGYGHGHGMSQYGALGAARRGLTARQILSFYYPGTTLGSGAGAIRVLVSADTDDDVRVVPQSGMRVRDVATGASYAIGASGATTWRLRSVNGRTVLDYYAGAWRSVLPGGKQLGSVAEFHRPGTLTLRVAGTTRVYRGALRLAAGNTVNVLGIDDYVKGVVPREMPASWNAAAVQAQAVAARTYASWDRAAHPTRTWQTCDTTSCQVYGGVSSEDPRSNAAVDATAGQVLLYGGKPAFTQFSSSSGGQTSAGSMPYLVGKADPYDDHAANPVHDWTKTVTAAAIAKRWPAIGTLRRIVVTQREGSGEWYGRVEKLVLDGSRSDVTVGGSTFRSAFGLRSTFFKPAGGTTTPTTSPATPAVTTPSAITARWTAIGGHRSVVGSPVAAEQVAGPGRLRRFESGRIYWRSTAGAHELHGKVLRAYRKRGGVDSRLGFPTTAPHRFSRGVQARFEHGLLRVHRSGKVRITWS